MNIPKISSLNYFTSFSANPSISSRHLLSRCAQVLNFPRLSPPGFPEHLFLPHQHLRHTARIPHHQNVLIHIRDVHVSGILHLLGDVDGLSEHRGRFVGFREAHVGVDGEVRVDRNLRFGSAEELGGNGGVDARLGARDGDLQVTELDQRHRELPRQSQREQSGAVPPRIQEQGELPRRTGEGPLVAVPRRVPETPNAVQEGTLRGTFRRVQRLQLQEGLVDLRAGRSVHGAGEGTVGYRVEDGRDGGFGGG
mmetsp:Transcript_10766/g.22571  ORF Transcript_10766/g.22571 Transcript_10766/m.22571 type:complete len:252 (+) Transcript_10766:107-862(+)